MFRWDTHSPLHEAIKVGDLEKLRNLIKLGKDLESVDHKDNTPLILAAAKLHLFEVGCDMVRALVEAGCDVNATNVHGDTALRCAATNRSAETVQLLLEAGCTADTGSLITASGSGDAEMVSTLIEFGADVDGVDKNGMAPLLSACATIRTKGSRQHEVVKLLMEARCNLDVTFSMKTMDIDFLGREDLPREFLLRCYRDGLTAEQCASQVDGKIGKISKSLILHGCKIHERHLSRQIYQDLFRDLEATRVQLHEILEQYSFGLSLPTIVEIVNFLVPVYQSCSNPLFGNGSRKYPWVDTIGSRGRMICYRDLADNPFVKYAEDTESYLVPEGSDVELFYEENRAFLILKMGGEEEFKMWFGQKLFFSMVGEHFETVPVAFY